MRFPERAHNLSDEDKKIIFEFYGLYSNRQWFDKVELLVQKVTPTQTNKVLQLSCNYNPLLEMKEILSFTQRYNLTVETIDLSHRD